ncbi:Septum formation initiator [Saccharomonospora marina XMU15]|uniref:Septum formation initiator n=1 Tax=Saccharomonospora marina XMU15 TaxID=882083 RepID=H5XAJ9_9PSEU|nr:septum formation initiator family protein [Saccharomonospora marina]EHR50429.1 Septum formation initiator [Saccharomonospora marina XMU15]
MTAPARTRNQPTPRTRQRPKATTGTQAPETPNSGAAKRRTSAAERAYARKAQRTKVTRPEAQAQASPQRSRIPLLRWPRSRTSFVLLLMAMMVTGVAATLWLSTQAITDSYRLEQLRQENAGLAERSEQLQREVSHLESPSSLAERARQLGMVPGGNPARLVVRPDGSVVVVGEPSAASAPPPSRQEQQPEQQGVPQQQLDDQAQAGAGEPPAAAG